MCTGPSTPLAWQINISNVTLCIGWLPSTPLTYPGSCKSCLSRIPVLGRKVFLIFPIIYHIAHLHNWPISPLILPTSTLNDIFTHFGGFFAIFMGQLALKFYLDKTCFFWHLWHYKWHWNYSISHAKTSLFVNLLTVQEAHKEYNSSTDHIWTKNEQLDSGKYWAVGIPAFNAEACELANLLAQMSKLC